MGDCTSRPARPPGVKNYQEPSQSSRKPQLDKQEQPEVKQPEKPLETLEKLPEMMEKEAQVDKQEKQWLEEELEQVRVTKHEHPHPLRELALLVQEINYHYHNHDIDSSIQYIGRFQESLKSVGEEMKLTQQEVISQLGEQIERWKEQIKEKELNGHSEANKKHHQISDYSAQLIRQVKKQHTLMTSIIESVESGGWEEQERSESMVIHTRREQDDQSVGAVIEVDFRVPFENFLTLMGQPSLFKEFMPHIEESRLEKKFSRNSKVGYSRINLPVIACRESFFQALAYSRLRTHGEFLMMTQSLNGNQQLQDYLGYQVRANYKCVQLKYKYMLARYRPIGPNHGKLTLATNVDFGLNFLPFFILEMVCIKFAKDLLQRIDETNQKFEGSPWEKKIQEDPNTYMFFKGSLQSYLSEKGMNSSK